MEYGNGFVPSMLVEERFDRLFFRDVVEAIFATSSRDEANAVIEEFSKFWMSIPGTRGAIGKKTVNAQTYFNSLFDTDDDVEEQEEQELNEEKLEVLEDEQLHSEA